MKMTCPDLSQFTEGSDRGPFKDLTVPGALPLCWMRLSKAFRELVLTSPELHSTVVVVLHGGQLFPGDVVNQSVVRRQLALAGCNTQITLVLAHLDMEWSGLDAQWDEEEDRPFVDHSGSPVAHTLDLTWVFERSRCQLYSITFPITSDVLAHVATLNPISSPSLHHVQAWHPIHYHPVEQTFYDAGIWSVSLTTLGYEGCRASEQAGLVFSKVVDWARLKRLVFREGVCDGFLDYSPAHPSSIRAILEKASSLEELDVAINSVNYTAYDPPVRGWDKPIVAPLCHTKLRSLHIQCASNPNAVESDSFFAGLSFPHLAECRIHYSFDHPQPNLTLFLKSSLTLVVLELTGTLLPHATLVDVLGSLPMLIKLTLGLCNRFWPYEEFEARPQMESAHDCDAAHICDRLLRLLSGPGWNESMAAGFGSGFGMVDWILGSRPRALGTSELLCPRLKTLSLVQPLVTPMGLYAFLACRTPGLGVLEIHSWGLVDCYELGRLQAEVLRRFGVSVIATSSVRTTLRIVPSHVEKICIEIKKMLTPTTWWPIDLPDDGWGPRDREWDRSLVMDSDGWGINRDGGWGDIAREQVVNRSLYSQFLHTLARLWAGRR